MRKIKTYSKGIAKSRSGAPPLSLQTMIDRAAANGFVDEVRKHASAPPRVTKRDIEKAEVRRAKEILSESPSERLRGHVESGVPFGVASPGIKALGRGTTALIDAKRGNKLRAMRKALTNTTRGGVVGDVVSGTAAGTTLSAMRKGLQVQKAKDVYAEYLKERRRAARKKTAARERKSSKKNIAKGIALGATIGAGSGVLAGLPAYKAVYRRTGSIPLSALAYQAAAYPTAAAALVGAARLRQHLNKKKS